MKTHLHPLIPQLSGKRLQCVLNPIFHRDCQKFCVLGVVLTLHHLLAGPLGVGTDAGKTLLVEDGELVHRVGPMVCGRAPFDGNVSQRQPEQLNRRVVGREVAARFDDLA